MRLAAAAFVLATAISGAALADEAGKLVLTGTGSVSVAPDIATLGVGVTTRRESASEALSNNSASTAAVIDALRSGGVAEADLQTSEFSIGLQYKDRKTAGPLEVDYYVVNNSVTATVRDIAALGDVLDRVVRLGANRIGYVSFGVSDPVPHLDEARQMAVADALRKADLYAAAAGIELGPILSISEPSANQQPGFVAMARAESVPIAAGETSLTASINIVWQIKDPD